MKNYWTQSNQNIFVAAHRGWSEAYPENSMIAFQKAVELGVDQIEMDIRVTKDGELVVFHDLTVDRVSNGTGKVADFTLAELKQLVVEIDPDAFIIVQEAHQVLGDGFARYSKHAL